MGWFFFSWRSVRHPARPSRPAPKRNRLLTMDDLEGRRLLSEAMQSMVTLPSASSNIISGPDGDLWVAVTPDLDLTAIERIGLNGSVMSFPVTGNGTEGMVINSLTNGPDGNVWFDADFIDVLQGNPGPAANEVVIGNVTPTGVITEFPPIPVSAGQYARPSTMVSGPGGDLWFSDTVTDSTHPGPQFQNFIGQVTTAGAVTLFPIDSMSSQSPSWFSLATGADGNLWFTEEVGKGFILGRMTPSGVVTQFPIPGHLDWAQVANGPNGSLIVTGPNAKGQNEVFSVTTADAVTHDKVPAAISDAFFVYLGSADGSLWFTDESGSFQIGQITASDVATSHDLSHVIRARQNLVPSMALGQDGNLYLLNNAVGMNMTARVYRLSPSELPLGRGVGRSQLKR